MEPVLPFIGHLSWSHAALHEAEHITGHLSWSFKCWNKMCAGANRGDCRQNCGPLSLGFGHHSKSPV
eukprot:1068561-Prorocentrum_lima.AAC.1